MAFVHKTRLNTGWGLVTMTTNHLVSNHIANKDAHWIENQSTQLSEKFYFWKYHSLGFLYIYIFICFRKIYRKTFSLLAITLTQGRYHPQFSIILTARFLLHHVTGCWPSCSCYLDWLWCLQDSTWLSAIAQGHH